MAASIATGRRPMSSRAPSSRKLSGCPSRSNLATGFLEPGDSAHSTQHLARVLSDRPHVLVGEREVGGADDAVELFGAAGANDGRGDGWVLQRPRAGGFARRLAVLRHQGAQTLDQLEPLREIRLLEVIS